MIIKDKEYWKEYNLKRKDYLQQKYLQRKQVVNSTTSSDSSVVKSEVVKSAAVVETILQPKLEVVKSCQEIIQPELVVKKESLQPYSDSSDLKAKLVRLQSEVDNCQKRHTIPKEAEFINLMWDKRYKKLVFYNCAGSCWNGKYCNNCSSLEQRITNHGSN